MEVALVVVGAAALGAVAWRLRRRHRGVPRGWQTSQSVAADLHRRVHRSVDHTRREVAHAAARGAPSDELVSLCDQLDVQAIAIDRQLAAASQLPSSPKQRALTEVRHRIIALEQLAGRVERLAAELSGPILEATDVAIDDLRQRLDALDAARREAHGIGRDDDPQLGSGAASGPT